MKPAYVSIFSIVLVLMSGIPFMTGGGSAYAKFVSTKTQSQANINNCSNDSNCAITSPQTQGDGSASSPTNIQISEFNEQGQINGGGVGRTPDLTLLVNTCLRTMVIVTVTCEIIMPTELQGRIFICDFIGIPPNCIIYPRPDLSRLFCDPIPSLGIPSQSQKITCMFVRI